MPTLATLPIAAIQAPHQRMSDSPPALSRQLSHTRSITVNAYERSDGLWDIEASLLDTKSYDFKLQSGIRAAGEPVHHMSLSLTIDARFNVIDALAVSHRVPYPGYCDAFGDRYRALIGLNLVRDFRARVRERLGGKSGCTHITELAAVLPTAAVQAFAGAVVPTVDSAQDAEQAQQSNYATVASGGTAVAATGAANPPRRPFQIDQCLALRADGPAVARFYPRWFVQPLAAAAPAGDDTGVNDTTRNPR
jgi:hypothetical protein